MTSPPSRVRRVQAADLYREDFGYLLREYGEDDDAWKQVKARAFNVRRPHQGEFLPPVVTVKFSDDTERIFNPDDWVEVGTP